MQLAIRALVLAGLVAILSTCGGSLPTSGAIADWAIQQGDIEERVAATCLALEAERPERHGAEVLREHRKRFAELADLVAREARREQDATLVQACGDVKQCIDGGADQLGGIEALVASNTCHAAGCARAIAAAVDDVRKGARKPVGGALGMIGAIGKAAPLGEAALQLTFARASVYGIVAAADGADALVDEVASALGDFGPLVRPILRRIAAALLAEGVDQVLERLERAKHKSGIAVAESACEVIQSSSVKSDASKTALQRIILRFDGPSFDSTLGVTFACTQLSDGDDTAVCDEALQAATSKIEDGDKPMVLVPPVGDIDPPAPSTARIDALQSDVPTAIGPQKESVDALQKVADACLEKYGFGADACKPARLVSIVSFNETYILSSPTRELDLGALEARAGRIEEQVVKTGREVSAGFTELFECRRRREQRDVISAAVGYRPLLPCTRPGGAENLRPFAANSILQPVSGAEFCGGARLTLPILVGFREPNYAENALSDAVKLQLKLIGENVQTLESGMAAVKVKGFANQTHVVPGFCKTLQAELKKLQNGDGGGKATISLEDAEVQLLVRAEQWECADAKPANVAMQKQLNEGLALLRAVTVCKLLGAECTPTGVYEKQTTVELTFASEDMRLSDRCRSQQ